VDITKLKYVFSLFLFGVGISLLVNQFGFALSVVNGTSMNPTLHHGDRLFINKFTCLLSTPKRGEVITFKDPMNQERYLVKRVIGIPGDCIQVENGKLYRNQRVVEEKYSNSLIEDGDFGPVVVKPGTVFVMGDNRHRFQSRDSRYQSVGLVPEKLINGKVEWILWSPHLEAYL
jgi:signal peptidase I